jgi:1-acyl-sn-glycerol-3-phosphate acyltransferase
VSGGFVPARVWPWFCRLFEVYARWLVRRNFSAVRVRGALAPPGGPVLYLVNHSSWWDAILVFLLSRPGVRVPQLAMMGEAGMRRYPFFNRLGAFSVPEAKNLADLRAMIRYLEVQGGQGGQIWIFPQGTIAPADVRPLGLERGVALLAARLVPCRVVPVAIRFVFGEAKRPEILVSFGSVSVHDEAADRQSLERLLTDELEKLRIDIAHGASTNFERWDQSRSSSPGQGQQ